jgi:hypothetical protein
MRKTLITLAGVGAVLSGIASCRSYEVKDHLRGSETGLVSHAPHSLEFVPLFGEAYVVKENEESELGYALIPSSKLTERTNEEGRRKGLMGLVGYSLGIRGTIELRNKVYLARQLKAEGKPASKVTLKTGGKYGIKAERRLPDITRNMEVQTIKNPIEYYVKTLIIKGQEAFFPYLNEPPEGRLNFLTVLREGHLSDAGPEGQITLTNPGNIYEWVDEAIIEREEQAEEQRRKQREAAEREAEEAKKKAGEVQEAK